MYWPLPEGTSNENPWPYLTKVPSYTKGHVLLSYHHTITSLYPWQCSIYINYWCVIRGHFVYAPDQWETMLHCNVVSHWLGAYTKWSLEMMLMQAFNPMDVQFWLEYVHLSMSAVNISILYSDAILVLWCLKSLATWLLCSSWFKITRMKASKLP